MREMVRDEEDAKRQKLTYESGLMLDGLEEKGSESKKEEAELENEIYLQRKRTNDGLIAERTQEMVAWCVVRTPTDASQTKNAVTTLIGKQIRTIQKGIQWFRR